MSTNDKASTGTSEASDPKGVTGRLVNWIHSTSLDNVPTESKKRAKYLMLDGLACALVAAQLPWSQTAVKGVLKMESPGRCTVIGHEDLRVGPLAAALINSTFIQGFELDDYHGNAPLHSNSLVIPALLAAVEQENTAVSGADFLEAFIVGCEVGPRVGLALHGHDLLSRGWHSGAVQGPSASVSAVSKLLRLTPAQTEWALGIACTQAGGLMSAQFGSMAKRMQHGFGSRNGLFAAYMARENYTGIEQVYETSYGGFLSCFGQGANHDPATLPDELVGGLGSRWELEGIRVKLHAAMAVLHGTIDCIENLQRDHPDLFAADKLSEIDEITTEHASAAYEHGGWIAPEDKPLSSTGAQMSIPYAAAAQLLDGQVLMEQFGAAKLNRSEVRSLMAKVNPTHNKDFDASAQDKWKTVVTVKFKGGQSVSEYLDAPRGIDPPVTNEQIVDKWRRLVKGVVTEERRDAIEQFVLGLDDAKDVRELAKLLQGTVQCPIDV
nr:cis-aconitate decarboxylase [Quercus suber]